MKKIAFAALLACAFTSSQAEVVTFDTVTPGTLISNGYAGLDWSEFGVLDGTGDAHSGYQNGVVSGNNVAYNNYAHPATISAPTSAGFDLYSGYFTGAWNNGLQITASAIFENHSTASLTFTANESGPVDEVFGWKDLASVTFTTAGGTPAAGVVGSGEHFALDNLVTTAAVPEPANVALLLAGLGLMGFVARRRQA